MLAPVLVAAGLLLSGCSGSTSGPPVRDVSVRDDDGLAGAVLPKPYQLPDVRLTASDGSAYRLRSDTTAPLTLVFFGYTSCPDICQVVMADIASALNRLEPADRRRVGMLFVTTDPARDDATALRAYVDRFDPAFRGLTGPLPRIVRAAEALGVPVEKGQRLPTGGYEVAHGTQVLGVLPDGTAPVVWTQGTPPDRMAQDIHAILDSGVPSPTPKGARS